MDISNSKKPLSLPLLAFITINLMLLHTVNAAEVVSFTYDLFDDDADLILQGDASISHNKALQLTKVDNNNNPLGYSVGRALHCDHVRLFDSSGKKATFYTSFVFYNSAPCSTAPADGLTFFLASPETTIPPNSGGGLFGLFSDSNALNNSRKELVGFKASSDDKVVAVEFDTFPNPNLGDPDYKHIGIDVNSIRSQVTREWDWQNGQPLTVEICHDPADKKLHVYASYPSGDSVYFTHDIDLTTVLPELVRVGFSGTTGLYTQVNNIKSWYFASALTDLPGRCVGPKGRIASVVRFG